MHALENKIPPPLIALLCALLMAGAAYLGPVWALPPVWQWSISLVLLLLGAWFCLAGAWAFRQARTTVNPLKPGNASALVRGGVYRCSRNPMYVGFALFLLAWACYLQAPWALLGVLVFVAYITRFQIIPEERALAGLFGDEFTVYQKQVRRWI